jgi:hypothetical protein
MSVTRHVTVCQLCRSTGGSPDGVRGFDTAERLTSKIATAFCEHGYRYCVRYVRRDMPHPKRDLNAAEASAVLDAGLGLNTMARRAPSRLFVAGKIP